MNRIFQISVCIMLFVASCSQKQTTVYQYCNQLNISNTNMLINNELDSSLQLSEQRYLVYFHKESCSFCFGGFSDFLKNINDYRFDSLLIVACDAYDFVQTNYFLKKSNLTLPSNTRIIIDPKNKIFDEMTNTYGDINLFLIEDKRILYYNNTAYFKYDESYGYVIDPNPQKNSNISSSCKIR